jgi:TonB-dependent receptor
MGRGVSIGILLALTTMVAQAGTIRGTVTDESGLKLAGANLALSGGPLGTAADLDGEYRLGGVEPGRQRLVVSYMGYQTREVEVEVPESGAVRVDLRLESALVQGDEVVVTGERLKGQARSLSIQRANPQISNIVSSDQVGRFPDANVGDALKRIPSITVNYDQGEARFVNVRGTEPRLNSVMINGSRIPSAEGEKRAVQVDLVPSDMVQAIEVSKAVLPEMEADAIGGSINLVTRTAPADRRFSGTLGTGLNLLTDEPVWNGSFTAGDRLLDDKLGVVLSGSIHDHRLGSHNSEGVWTRNDDGDLYVEEWDIRTYEIRRLRRSLAATLDYRLAPSHTLFLRSMYNHRDDWENRFRLTYKLDEPDGNGVVQEAELRRQTKGGSDDDLNDNARLEDQRVTTLGLAGEHLFDNDWRLDWGLAWAEASEERPDERYIGWRVKDVPVQVDISDPEEPDFQLVNGSDGALDQFGLRELTEEYQWTEEQDLTLNLDLRLPLERGPRPSTLKVGMRHKTKDKERDNDFHEYEFLAEPDHMGETATDDYSESDFLAGDYAAGRFSTPEYLGGLDFGNPALFEGSRLREEFVPANYTATETVMAFYGQYDKRLTERLGLLAGLRLEATDVEYEGNEYFVDADSAVVRDGGDDYMNLLPGLHLRYELDAATVVRLAWTNTLARPNYYDLVPYRAYVEEDLELSLGNPALEPTTSMNFDLMVERYYANVGLLSLGVFSKSIRDFIYMESREEDLTVGGSTDTWSVLQPVNGAEATLWGLEGSLQRRLDFLPGALRHLSVYFNYTYTHSTTDNPAFGDREVDLPGAAPHTLNSSLSYEDGTLALGLAYNYNAAYLDPDDVDLTPGLERYYDATHYLDFNASWRVSPSWLVFLEANNLLNQPLRYYAGDSGRTYQAEYYDRRLNAGVKFDL